MCSKAPIRVRQRKECADSFLESKSEVDYSSVLRSLLALAVPALLAAGGFAGDDDAPISLPPSQTIQK